MRRYQNFTKDNNCMHHLKTLHTTLTSRPSYSQLSELVPASITTCVRLTAITLSSGTVMIHTQSRSGRYIPSVSRTGTIVPLVPFSRPPHPCASPTNAILCKNILVRKGDSNSMQFVTLAHKMVQTILAEAFKSKYH